MHGGINQLHFDIAMIHGFCIISLNETELCSVSEQSGAKIKSLMKGSSGSARMLKSMRSSVSIGICSL